MKRFITLFFAALMSVGMSWAMQIYIDVPEQDLLALDVEPSDNIENVKGKIQDKTSIPPEDQTLYFNSTLLEDDRTLKDYNILEESTLQLAISGGSTDVIPCTTADLGKVLCTDGSIYATVSEATAASKTAAAVITYVDTENAKALALALADDGIMDWEGAKTTAPAHTPVVSNGTWTLASKDDWDNMINAAGDYTALRDGFSAVGGTNMLERGYWSSTIVDFDNDDFAWNYDFKWGIWYDQYQVDHYYVRACLAFDIPAAPQPEPTTYTLTLASNDVAMGTVIVEGEGIVDNQDGTYTVAEGTEVTIVAQSAEGYHLASWSNEAALNENDSQTITITDNTTITAVFAADVVTPVANVDAENAETEVWFDITGRRLQGKPSTPGLYIRNGKKALVK